MDSFYDQPRKPPAQKAIPMAIDKVLPEIIPEVSMLLENRGNVPQRNAPMSYNAWKLQKSQPIGTAANKENFCGNLKQQPSLYRKQVRFQSPCLQQTDNKMSRGNDSMRKLPPLNNEHALPSKFLHDAMLNDSMESDLLQRKYAGFQCSGEAMSQSKQVDMLQKLQGKVVDNFQTNMLQINNFHANMLQNKPADMLQKSPKSVRVLQNKPVDILQKRLDNLPGMLQTNVPPANHLQNDATNRGNMLQSNADVLQTTRIDSMLNRVDNVLQTRGGAQRNLNILQSKPFEKIYMANIPNRTLDLSIIEPPAHNKPQLQNAGLYKPQLHNRESQLQHGELYKAQFQNGGLSKPQLQNGGLYNPRELNKPPVLNRSDSLEELRAAASSDLFKRKTDTQQANSQEMNLIQAHRAESTTIESKRNEPSVTDLLQIIRQQNEQLICLQQQVSTLLQERSSEIKKIEAPPLLEALPAFNKKLLEPKFSVDVMTSFEVSIRPQNNYNRKFGSDARITEITELDSTKATDVSLALAEPVVVRRDEELSPENSIHVDMQDFSSESEAEESNSSLIGWTIYNNVMDQVNYLLHKSQDNQEMKSTKPSTKLDGATMKQVKEVTLKHLKNIGFDLSKMNENDSLDYKNCEYTPSEISFAVKQLLMKYLPDEHLSRFNEAKDKTPPLTRKYPTNLIKRRPEFSMATVQYMEKYNLLNNDGGMKKATHFDKNREGKLLDITALKRQPKFL